MIRPVQPDDLPSIKAVIGATGLFPPDMHDEMIAPYLSGADEAIWLTDGRGGAVAYCAPEPMTEGTWNLYLIAVHPDRQSQGSGAAILAHLEGLLRHRGARLLLVETSGLPAFGRTRAFYSRNGYAEEARLRDFYQTGEDKIVFRKSLVD